LGFGGCKQTVHDSKIINAEEKEKKDDGEKEKKKKLPFQQDSMMFSTKAMNESFLSKVSHTDAMIPVNQLEKRLSLLTH
jgi:ATP-dependent Clp protease protease subunit